MRVGIIAAGDPPPALVPAFGTYADMTRALLGPAHDYATYRVFEGDVPARPADHDAYVVTGSAAGVYEPLPWIAPLEDLLRAAAGRCKLIGICFGHQILAQAFGGTVRKAAQGWSLGLHRYAIRERAPWMDEDVAAIVATASHQDQVLVPPPRSRTLASSAFTPYAMLAYDDHPSVSFQFHPEFAPDFSRALFSLRRAPDLAPEAVATSIGSLDGPNDNARVARWLDAFLAG